MRNNLARTERLRLVDAARRAGEEAPTLCEGWTTRDLATHLVIRERHPGAAAGIFMPKFSDRQLTPEEKDAASHRGRALRALAPALRDLAENA